MHVLLIDDDEQIRTLLRENLEAMGAIVTEAESQRLALGIPREKFTFDLIVTDVDSIDLDGFAFIEHIESTIGPQRVMFVSGTDHEKRVRHRCAEHPCTVWEFARKPFSRQTFQTKIASLMARNPSIQNPSLILDPM